MRAPYTRPRAALTPPKNPRKRQSLIGNGMHSPARATAFKSATSIFLIGNEFHFVASAESRSLPAQAGLTDVRQREATGFPSCLRARGMTGKTHRLKPVPRKAASSRRTPRTARDSGVARHGGLATGGASPRRYEDSKSRFLTRPKCGMTTIRARQGHRGTERNSPLSNRHLIHCPELDIELTHTKHALGLVSNRQFFAF